MKAWCSDGKERTVRLAKLQLFTHSGSVSVHGKTISGFLVNEIDHSSYPGKLTGRTLFIAHYWGKNYATLPNKAY